jgi:hypothetical protein
LPPAYRFQRRAPDFQISRRFFAATRFYADAMPPLSSYTPIFSPLLSPRLFTRFISPPLSFLLSPAFAAADIFTLSPFASISSPDFHYAADSRISPLHAVSFALSMPSPFFAICR